MSKLAVIKTGGKQYIVKEGQMLRVEKLEAEENKPFSFDQILLVADDAGTDVKIGMPTVAGAKVSSALVKQGRAKKIRVVHYKSKTRYHKVAGHRQPFSQVKIEKIN